MQIYKRGAVWWYKFKFGGETIRRSAGREASKTEARRIGTEHRRQLEHTILHARQGIKPRRLFDDALLEWLNGDAKALKSYRETVNHARQIRDFTRGRTLEEGHEIAKDIKQTLLGEGLKPATINQRLAIIRRVLNLAHDWGWIDTPLGKKIKLLPPNNERHMYLTPEQLFALADAAADPSLLPPSDAATRRPYTPPTLDSARETILLAGYAGLRLSEIYALQPAQLRAGALWIPPTKGKRAGKIPLPAFLHQITLPITITKSRLRTRFEVARSAIGMPDLHFHDLRHTFASLLADAGAEMADVRDLMRHTSIASTTRYLHLMDKRKDALAKRMHKHTLTNRGTKRGTS